MHQPSRCALAAASRMGLWLALLVIGSAHPARYEGEASISKPVVVPPSGWAEIELVVP